jgi:hypothetical protein
MRIHQLTEEIKQYAEPTKKSAYELFRVLDNNRKLFSEHLDAATVNSISAAFEELSNAHPSDYGSPAFVRAFEIQYQSLLYHLQRVI